MARRQNARFSIYDALDANGYFDGGPQAKFPGNPANAEHADYKGPVEYPRMFYHPEGKERVVVPAEIIETPMGAKLVNEHRELICAIAADAAEAAKFRAAGWHDHPAKANAKAGRAVAPQTASDKIAELEAEIRRLTAARNSEQAILVAADRAAGATVAGGPLSASEALGEGDEAA